MWRAPSALTCPSILVSLQLQADRMTSNLHEGGRYVEIDCRADACGWVGPRFRRSLIRGHKLPSRPKGPRGVSGPSREDLRF